MLCKIISKINDNTFLKIIQHDPVDCKLMIPFEDHFEQSGNVGSKISTIPRLVELLFNDIDARIFYTKKMLTTL